MYYNYILMITEKCGLLVYQGNNNKMLMKNFIVRLEKLQHRGRDAVGLCYLDENNEYKTFYAKGIIYDIFFNKPTDDIQNILNIESKLILGHLRYATSNIEDTSLIQPLADVNRKMAVAHNGNIPKAMLKCIIKKINDKYFDFDINDENLHDTNTFFEYVKQYGKTENSMEKHLEKSYKYFNGSYNFIILHNESIYVLRDKNAYRPICYGKNLYGDLLISSETVSFLNDYKYINDLPYGETLKVKNNEIYSIKKNDMIRVSNKSDCKYKNCNCSFEYIYFMNEKSKIMENDNANVQINVDYYRIKSGEELAIQEKNYEHLKDTNPNDVIVVGSPKTAIVGAKAYAKYLSYPYLQVLEKKPNVGRTFILPNDNDREKYFKKFVLDTDAIKNKIIIFVDDSVVRGNTVKNICHLFKTNGAKEIHVRVLSPPVKNPCYYGVHIPTDEELLMNKMDKKEIINKFNLESIEYLDIKKMDNIFSKNMCKACFNGNYNPDILF